MEEARNIIGEVDSQMAKPFIKLMRSAEMVCEHGKAFGLPILDRKALSRLRIAVLNELLHI